MISDNRLKHIIGVARQAKNLAAELRPNDIDFQQNMFLLGFLHDFGYEFSTENNPHAMVGGEILKQSGYKYWEEVYNHGNPDVVDMTDELYILNYADMTTSPDGCLISMEERIKEIGQRYGFTSEAYLKSQKEIELLKKDKRFSVIFQD